MQWKKLTPIIKNIKQTKDEMKLDTLNAVDNAKRRRILNTLYKYAYFHKTSKINKQTAQSHYVTKKLSDCFMQLRNRTFKRQFARTICNQIITNHRIGTMKKAIKGFKLKVENVLIFIRANYIN